MSMVVQARAEHHDRHAGLSWGRTLILSLRLCFRQSKWRLKLQLHHKLLSLGGGNYENISTMMGF